MLQSTALSLIMLRMLSFCCFPLPSSYNYSFSTSARSFSLSPVSLTICLLFSPATIPNFLPPSFLCWCHCEKKYRKQIKKTNNPTNLKYQYKIASTVKKNLTPKSNQSIRRPLVRPTVVVSYSTETERRQTTMGLEENLLGINKYHCAEGKCSSFCVLCFCLFLLLFA